MAILLLVGCETRGALVSEHDSAWINVERGGKRLYYCYIDQEGSPVCVEPLYGRPFAKPAAKASTAPKAPSSGDATQASGQDYTDAMPAGQCAEIERANGEVLKRCPSKLTCSIKRDFSKGELTEVCP